MANATMFKVIGRLSVNPKFDQPFLTKNGKRIQMKKFVIETDDNELFCFTAMMGGTVLENSMANKELPEWFKPLQTAPIGTMVEVQFGVRTTSKDGKYYTELYCNKITEVQTGKKTKAAEPEDDFEDDMPF